MNAWLGVVSAEHVRRGVALGIAQVHHGKKAGLARMSVGDWLVYYSPRQRMRDGDPVKAFTAIGQIADDEIWQADEGDFRPYRRRVEYLEDVHDAPISELMGRLDLTSVGPSWGVQLRRGLLALSDGDLAVIREAMVDHE